MSDFAHLGSPASGGAATEVSGRTRLDIAGEWLDRHWKLVTVCAWIVLCLVFLIIRWRAIQTLALPDTDDNLRLMQVRDWLSGQGWFDLRQYRMNPPAGANIHWSRIVDLPIAGLILLLRPAVGAIAAEKAAVAIAPMLPLLLLMGALASTTRRLVDRRTYPLAFVLVAFASLAAPMFMPERIDHHGWQLALLSTAMAGMADPRRLRGGALTGTATAVSLAVGLEMLPALAVMGVGVVLLWVADSKEAERMRAFALSTGAGTAIAFVLFSSEANRQPVCDALSPVWLSVALLGSALLLGLGRAKSTRTAQRHGLSAAAAAVLVSFYVLVWPHCLGRLEGVSPEVDKLWLNGVWEALPVYRHGGRIAFTISMLPLTGSVGWALLAWSNRRNPRIFPRLLTVAASCAVTTALLLWQTRTAAAAQVLAVPGATALLCLLLPRTQSSQHLLVRTFGTAAVLIVGLGAVGPIVGSVVQHRAGPEARALSCTSAEALAAVARQPKGLVLTYVDLGPALITSTAHDVIAGPYHRNGEQIVDVIEAFRGSAPQAQSIARKYRVAYVLICPTMSEGSNYEADAPRGFHAQLASGSVPAWLEPVPIPPGSTFKMWRVVNAERE